MINPAMPSTPLRGRIVAHVELTTTRIRAPHGVWMTALRRLAAGITAGLRGQSFFRQDSYVSLGHPLPQLGLAALHYVPPR